MEIRFFEDTNQRLSNNIREFEVKIDSSTNIKNKVKDLNQCPVCLQDVSADYKNNILKEENSKVKDLEESLHIHIKQKKEVNENLKEAKESLENLKEKDRKFDIIKIRLDSIKESSERIDDILQVKEKENDEIKKLDDRKGILLERINNLKDIENEFSLQKRELDNIQLKLKEKEIELAALRQDVKNTENIMLSLDREIETKLKIKDYLIHYGNIQEWLEKYFDNIINVMEKKIMLKVHHDFDSLFEKWFTSLVDTEELKIKLDDEFTPIIEQAGHEIDYNFLSGGEKTAAALAYRLALNQVINNLISTIKTKDLIILDEPTDGFSEAQLDRLRNVLDELNTKQTIIVSHESKIESFVQNIIRVEKRDSISVVI